MSILCRILGHNWKPAQRPYRICQRCNILREDPDLPLELHVPASGEFIAQADWLGNWETTIIDKDGNRKTYKGKDL